MRALHHQTFKLFPFRLSLYGFRTLDIKFFLFSIIVLEESGRHGVTGNEPVGGMGYEYFLRLEVWIDKLLSKRFCPLTLLPARYVGVLFNQRFPEPVPRLSQLNTPGSLLVLVHSWVSIKENFQGTQGRLIE